MISIFAVLAVSPASLAQSVEPIMSLSPSSYSAQRVGETLSITINVSDVHNLASWRADVTWDDTFLLLVSGPLEGPFLQNAGQTQFGNRNLSEETVEIEDTLYSGGASGSGVLATIKFTTLRPGVNSHITLGDTEFLDASSNQIAHQVQNATVSVTVPNEIVANAGEDQTVNEHVPTILNGSETYPSNGNLTFTWTLTDKTSITLSGKVVTYTFDIPGVHQVNLTVTDSEDRTSTATTQITVRDTMLPIATITAEDIVANKTVEIGQTVRFNGLNSYDPENGTIVDYFWDLGNGSIVYDPAELFKPSVNCQFNQSGVHTVTLTVTEDGGNNGTATFSLTVRRANDPLDLGSFILLIGVTLMSLLGVPAYILYKKLTKK
jgi:PKD repeat protein